MSDIPSERSAENRDADTQRRLVRDRYAEIATSDGGCCSEAETASDDACCEESSGTDSERLGYSPEDSAAVPDGADLGLGCGNPKAIADLEPGERVLDLGSGAGFDCFLAAREVGPEGQVIGVDMTPEMVEKARANAANTDAENVAFRLGEIEHLPVADASVDVVISNCVINLSPAKGQVFAEAFRALAPGGRLAVSDIVKTGPLPASVERDPDSLAACIAGASTVETIGDLLEEAGFVDIRIDPKADSAAFISEWDDEHDPSEYVVSAMIEARKPPAERT